MIYATNLERIGKISVIDKLLMNLILMRNGYPISIINMENREEYMKALEIVSVNNDYNQFIEVVKKSIDESLDTYLYFLG